MSAAATLPSLYTLYLDRPQEAGDVNILTLCQTSESDDRKDSLHQSRIVHGALWLIAEKIREIVDQAESLKFVMDLDATTDLPQAGVGMLWDLHREIDRRGGELHITNVPERTAVKLSYVNADASIRIYSTQEAAVAFEN